MIAASQLEKIKGQPNAWGSNISGSREGVIHWFQGLRDIIYISKNLELAWSGFQYSYVFRVLFCTYIKTALNYVFHVNNSDTCSPQELHSFKSRSRSIDEQGITKDQSTKMFSTTRIICQ